MAVIIGIVRAEGTSVFAVKGKWTTAVTLTHWRIDAGPIDTGELRFSRAGLDLEETRGFHEQVASEHLVRFEASLNRDGQRWELQRIIESNPTDDVEMTNVLSELRRTSLPSSPSHVVTVRQKATITDLGGDAGVNALREQVAQLVTPPWDGPDPNNRFIKLNRTDTPASQSFGRNPPVGILIRPLESGVYAECTLRSDNGAANRVLEEFLRDIGHPAAAAIGAEFTVTDATFAVPDAKRVEPFELPGVGTFEASYDVYFGSEHPRVSTNYHLSPPIPIPMFNDMPVEFAIWDGPFTGQAAKLAAEAINNLRNATAKLGDETARYVHQYYLDMRNQFSDAECADYGIDLDITVENIWEHVSFRNPPAVNPSLTSYEGLLHSDIAYIDFECECSWEPEHGLNLVFIHGERIGKVGPYDGHPTNAHAFADPSLLDTVFRAH